MITEAADGLLGELRDEFLSLYPRGRRLVAIDGDDGARRTRFADALGGVLEAGGATVVRASAPGGAAFAETEAALRASVVDPFRAGATSRDPDAVLLVDGALLLQPELRGIWHWSIGLLGAPEIRLPEPGGPIVRAPRDPSAIVDDTDPEHPRRVFADSC
ncbi:MAG: hypothetical protein J7480_06185 [Microbacteriaceae bacterium]|nr:hypothetical protein [Microbacteriaceae bacterium]